MPGETLSSFDLVRLAEQIDRDKSADWRALQERDYAIGRACPHGDGVRQLLCWLEHTGKAPGLTVSSPWVSEGALGLLVGSAFFVVGFLTMAGFLFAHASGLINVLWFFLLFVLLQFALCLVAATTLALTMAGRSGAHFTLNPARLVYARSIRQRRYWREFRSVFGLAFLRYGQGMGIGFVLGAIGAFLLVLAVNDFSFVWSSTFNLTNSALERVTGIISSPWATWLPGATLDAQVISDSRYHPAAGRFSASQVQSMHSWWPFLLAAMVCYALLPRVLLWLASRLLYRSRLRRTFVGYPGADLVLRRMNRPLVTTQGQPGTLEPATPSYRHVEPRPDVLLVSWSGAIDGSETAAYEELAGITANQVLSAGVTLEGDRETLAAAERQGVNHTIVVAKAWEPPLAELADFLEELGSGVSRELLIRPLGDTALNASKLDDWERFAGELPGGAVALAVLTPRRGGAEETGFEST